MDRGNHPSAKDDINPRLAQQIKKLPAKQQLILLKQLLKGDIVGALFTIIREMSEDKQLLLLEQLQQGPVASVNLEETEISLRDYARKPCMLSLSYAVEGRNFEGFMLDISPSGAFIETNEAFSVGQQIQLSFCLPNDLKQLDITGEILWQGLLGIGVKFKDISQEQTDTIRAFMAENENI